MTTMETDPEFLANVQTTSNQRPGTGPAIEPEGEDQPVARGITRREFLNYAWLASLGILLAEMGGVVYVFAMPRFRAGEFGGLFFMGIAADYTCLLYTSDAADEN